MRATLAKITNRSLLSPHFEICEETKKGRGKFFP
jgi:hypothetical protein